jgi:membrane associated rhomboid family serine protease
MFPYRDENPLLSGLPSLGNKEGGVAFWAHVGGFLAGATQVLVFRNRELVERHTLARLQYQ